MAETLPRRVPPAPPYPVLFRDNRFLVIDKPAGIAVHAGPRGGPNVEDALRPLARGRDGPWLAHRLDADTSGCLMIALRRSALHAAQAEFVARRVRKTYWAVVHGAPSAERGLCDARLIRETGARGWRMAASARGQEAVTEWRVLGRGDAIAWLELTPRTGRTHQVRAHCAAIGSPVLGDPVYGDGVGPLMLLARALSLALSPPVSATAPVPAHMRDALIACGWDC